MAIATRAVSSRRVVFRSRLGPESRSHSHVRRGRSRAARARFELICRKLEGTAEQSSADRGAANVALPLAAIEVVGTRKNGRVDSSVLSSSERHDVLDKMRRDVFHLRGAPRPEDVVRIDTTLQGASKARVRIVPPHGRAIEKEIEIQLTPEGESGIRVSGSLAISLDAIGWVP